MYEQMGRAHAELVHLKERSLRRQDGQGTVEYVGIILLLAVLLAGVVAAASKLNGGSIANTIIEKINAAMNKANPSPKH